MKIESLNNSKVKNWAKLKEKKYRDETNLFLVEGDHLLNSAMVNGSIVEIISTDETMEIPGIPFYLVTDSIMKKLSSQVSSSKVIGVCKKSEEQEIAGHVCLLDNIQDPGNLGTIIRSAVAFNINTLILSNDTVDLYNEKVIRASEGMIFHLNIIRTDLASIIKELKEKNYKIYGTDVLKGTNLKEITFPNKTAIIIGNEGKGMSEDLKKECDAFIHIDINCESLNAGVAASIIFYEVSSNGHNETK